MEAIDMWERKVTRDGQATAGEGNVGGRGETVTEWLSLSRSVEKHILGHLDRTLHPSSWLASLPHRGALQE